jgi:hypothetical protein
MQLAAHYAPKPFGSIARCLTLVLAIVSIACRTGSASHTTDDGSLRTTIDVQNQGFSDMRVYVIVSGVRTRLGIAPGNTTTVLTIPEYLLVGTTFLRFVCDPIGGNRTPVTEEIDVNSGDQLVLIINPGG